MKPVSVIIPTANRPKFLEEALSSVAQQTALSEIEEVIVSENGSNHESQAVCAKFKSLPIRYIFQDPPISALKHINVLAKQARAEFIAILHDDDWWGPEHLARSLQALNSHPDSVAVFSNYYKTTGPSVPFYLNDHTWLIWVISGRNFADPVVVLDEVSTMFVCLAWSWWGNAHYSTLVGRSDAMRDAISRNSVIGNYYDNDRQFLVFLSLRGKICYLTMPEVFIRSHQVQESNKESYSRFVELMIQTTRWLVKSFPENAAKAKELFNTTASGLEPDRLLAISNLLIKQLRPVLIEECGLKFIPVPPEKRGPHDPHIKCLLRQICPPVLWNAMHKAKSMLIKGAHG